MRRTRFHQETTAAYIERVFCSATTKAGRFTAARATTVLKPALTGDKLDRSYAEIGQDFNLSEGAIKVAVHRVRKRFGELLRAEVAETVQDPGHVDDEVRELITALSNRVRLL